MARIIAHIAPASLRNGWMWQNNLRKGPLFLAHYFDLSDWIDPINAAFKR